MSKVISISATKERVKWGISHGQRDVGKTLLSSGDYNEKNVLR